MADGNWSLAEAKAKFSEVVEKVMREGPQHVTRNGGPAVVVVAEQEWRSRGGGKTLAEVVFHPSVRGLFTDEEAETLFARDPDSGRVIEF